MLRDLGLLALRLTTGGIFAAHGYAKLFGGPGKQVPPGAAKYLGAGFVQAVEHGGPSAFATTLEQLGVPEPIAASWFVACVEFFGGVLLAIGWLTRPAALLLAGDMLVAVTKVHWRNGLIGQGGFEFSLSLLGSCLGLLGTGPGAISVDGAEQPEQFELSDE